MKKDTLFHNRAMNKDFVFNDAVADVFDDMLSRSVPFYTTIIDMTAALLEQLLPHGASIYDLGCSTGTTLMELARRLEDSELSLIGIDNAPAMLAQARRKAERFRTATRISFIEADITRYPLEGAGAILCNYTLQFLRPLVRADFLRRLHDALEPGGVLVLSEKIICPAPRLNRLYIDRYHTFKRQHGYSDLEIATKREALENVLIPFSLEENLCLLRDAGFAEVEPFFLWFNFAAFVGIKS
ncbi:MAG: carboxy-S-adenosyl-L-methionine synthase CmoA [Desulfobulbus propionicus]|nr:MAG: carboxy-S-adenosyl-L-methionine synthase CmoA [Desulfobulbus propionicus]